MSKKYLLIFLSTVAFVTIIIVVYILRFLVPEQKAPVTEDTSTIVSGSFDTTKLKTDEEWKKLLTQQQYHILREQGTELPFTGDLLHEKRAGTYISPGCNEPLFRSEQKYDSGTGWPSFWAPINPEAIVLRKDPGLPGQERIEVLDRCGGHLGHVFEDGPEPSGQRYCMNAAALLFIPDDDQEQK